MQRLAVDWVSPLLKNGKAVHYESAGDVRRNYFAVEQYNSPQSQCTKTVKVPQSIGQVPSN